MEKPQELFQAYQTAGHQNYGKNKRHIRGSVGEGMGESSEGSHRRMKIED